MGLYGSIPEDGSTFDLSTDRLDIKILDVQEHKVERAIVMLKALKSEDDEEKSEALQA